MWLNDLMIFNLSLQTSGMSLMNRYLTSKPLGMMLAKWKEEGCLTSLL